jgi:Lectin C-type domain
MPVSVELLTFPETFLDSLGFLLFTASFKVNNLDYWTSAINHGSNCVEKWGWCSSNTTFTPGATFWKNGKPTGNSRRCAQINLEYDPKKMWLEDIDCSTPRYYICEVCNGCKKLQFHGLQISDGSMFLG